MTQKIVLHIVVFLFLVGALWGSLRWFEHANLYFPEKEIGFTPAYHRLPFEEVFFNTADGVKLHGWLVPAEESRDATPVVLFVHGNGGNIGHRMEKILFFHRLGASVFIYDHRGYGRSAGWPSEKGLVRDAEAAYHWLIEKRGVPYRRIVLYGESLGAAVVADLARTFPAKGVVLESAFTSTVKMGERIFPFLPVRFMVRQKYDTLSKIPEIRVPVMVMHSRTDEIVPYAMGKELFEKANEPKIFLELTGGHNDGFMVSMETVEPALRSFLFRQSG